MVTDVQVKTLWRWLRAGKPLAVAAMRSDMDRKTAAKYQYASHLPSAGRAEPRGWRTRANPFLEEWPRVESLLRDEPQLKARTLFEWLQREHPGKFPDSQLRTFQRHVKQWRALYGPSREVFFPQDHEPGALASSDFTHMDELQVTIARQPYPHMLYHFVLTYSNWETAVICQTESFESLSNGLQTALWELGGVPDRHRTDRLSAAIQNLSDRKEFTERYRRLMDHYSLTGEKTNARSPNENGDVEQAHYRLSESIDQALLLRGSRDFASIDEYADFLRDTMNAKNANRRLRFQEEQARLKPLPSTRLDHRKRVDVTVSSSSLIRVDRNIYSVPSRLIGEKVRAVIDVDWIEIYYAQQKTERLPRLRGRGKSRVNYRHIIDWLVRKPGALANYRYQADLFPTTRFRIAYDELLQRTSPAAASKQYLKILHLAATDNEHAVDEALRVLIEHERPLSFEAVKQQIGAAEAVRDVCQVYVEPTRLSDFDSLFSCMEVWNDERERVVDVTIEGSSLASLS
jgi:hypothetical protein